MPTAAQSAQSFLAELAEQPGARTPATFSENWNAAWAASGLDTIFGLNAPRDQAYDELNAAVTAATGDTIEAILGRNNVRISRFAESKAAAVAPYIAALPEEQRREIEPLLDIQANAARIAREAEQRAAETAANTYGLSGWAGAFLGGTARVMLDPVNLATLGIGGPAVGIGVRGILAFLGREAALGAGIQAAQEPAIEIGRARLGLEAGLGRAFVNIAGTAAGSAGLAGLFRGAAAVTRLTYRAMMGPPAPRRIAAPGAPTVTGTAPRSLAAPATAPIAAGAPIVPGAAPGTAPVAAAAVPTPIAPTAPAPPRPPTAAERAGITAEDFEAVAQLAQREAVIDAAASPQTAAGRERTRTRMATAEADAEAGRMPVEPAEEPLIEAGRQERDPSSAATAGVRSDDESIILPNGARLPVRAVIMELEDIIVSNHPDGRINTAFPAGWQPRDRTTAQSQAFIIERAAPDQFRPELLAERGSTADRGPPLVTRAELAALSGNGRLLMLELIYRQHPDSVKAYQAYLQSQGFDLEGFAKPVLVRIIEGRDIADPMLLARQLNIPSAAQLGPTELAFADARLIDDEMLRLWRGGDIGSEQNALFVRRFSERIVASEERTNFLQGRQLSRKGEDRIEAALMARAYEDRALVDLHTQALDPHSRAIIGGMADAAPAVAQLRTAIEAGRVPKKLDPIPAIVAAFRLVARARGEGQKVSLMVDQRDFETGELPSPEVRNNVRDFFRNDALTSPAGRKVVTERIEKQIDRLLSQENALGDMFGGGLTPEINAAASTHAGELLDDIEIAAEVAPLLQPEPMADIFARAAADHEARMAEVTRALETAGGLRLRRPDGQAEVLVHKAPGDTTPYRLTRFDKGEPVGHMDLRDLEDAARAIAGMRNWERVPTRNRAQETEPPPEGVPARAAAPAAAGAAEAPAAVRDLAEAAAAAAPPPEAVAKPVPPAMLAELDVMYADAPARQAELEAIGAEIEAAIPGVKFEPPPGASPADRMKARATTEGKIGRKGYVSTTQLTDIVRISFMIEGPPVAGDAVIARLIESNRFDVKDEGWAASLVRYVDRKVLVRFPSGLIGEIQLHNPNVLEAKQKGGGHDLYVRSLKLSDGPEKDALDDQQIALYSAALEEAGPDWVALGKGGSEPKSISKVSWVTRRPLSETSAELTGTQPAPGARMAQAAEVPPTMTAGRPSQSAKRISRGIATEEPPTPIIGVEGAPEQAAGAAPLGETEITAAIGDPQLRADLERMVEEHGDQFEIELGADETARKMTLRQALDEADEDIAATNELVNCMGGATIGEAA